MTLKLKSTTNKLWKGWKLAWYHHFTHIACAKKLRGLRQKLDALRVQNRQSLSKYQGFRRKLICYKGFSIFFELIWTPDFLCVQNEPFKATSSIFNPFWLHFLFFMHLLIFFDLNDPEIEKHYKWTLNRLKVGMVSSIHPITCAKKLRGLRQKLDALHVQNGQFISKYQGFGQKLICYTGISFF